MHQSEAILHDRGCVSCPLSRSFVLSHEGRHAPMRSDPVPVVKSGTDHSQATARPRHRLI